MVPNGRLIVSDELEMSGKWSWLVLRYYPRMTGLRVQNWTWDLPNTKRYHKLLHRAKFFGLVRRLYKTCWRNILPPSAGIQHQHTTQDIFKGLCKCFGTNMTSIILGSSEAPESNLAHRCTEKKKLAIYVKVRWLSQSSDLRLAVSSLRDALSGFK
jgi:hypothetical protein